MRVAIPPLPQYTLMALCSVKKAQGQTLPLTFYNCAKIYSQSYYFKIKGVQFIAMDTVPCSRRTCRKAVELSPNAIQISSHAISGIF
jgi:hypothetical protein